MSNGRLVRQNIENMSQSDLDLLRSALGTLQDFDPRDGAEDRSFQTIAGFHGVPRFLCPHGDILFLPWHRAYLYFFEQYLRDTYPEDQDLLPGIPWWDWSSDISHSSVNQGGGIPNRFRQTDNQPNPLAGSFIDRPIFGVTRNTIRNPSDPSTLPSNQDVIDLLDINDFTQFSFALEQFPFHDAIHGWVGGDMGSVAFAAYDPIFHAHHCMVDRIWYLWQLRHGLNSIPRSLLRRSLEGFPLSVEDVLDISELGYEYAVNQIVV